MRAGADLRILGALLGGMTWSNAALAVALSTNHLSQSPEVLFVLNATMALLGGVGRTIQLDARFREEGKDFPFARELASSCVGGVLIGGVLFAWAMRDAWSPWSLLAVTPVGAYLGMATFDSPLRKLAAKAFRKAEVALGLDSKRGDLGDK